MCATGSAAAPAGNSNKQAPDRFTACRGFTMPARAPQSAQDGLLLCRSIEILPTPRNAHSGAQRAHRGHASGQGWTASTARPDRGSAAGHGKAPAQPCQPCRGWVWYGVGGAWPGVSPWGFLRLSAGFLRFLRFLRFLAVLQHPQREALLQLRRCSQGTSA